MKKVAFVVYRAWAFDIYKSIVSYGQTSGLFDLPLLITIPQAEFDISFVNGSTHVYTVEGNDNLRIAELLSMYDIDIVFYYGWSWIVKEPILSSYTCICLHPSLLPRYRGGSPIQHQILAGETESAVSLFRMSEGIDDGDIYKHAHMSLEGSLMDIFTRMTEAGTLLTKNLIHDFVHENINFTPQKYLEQYPPLQRRTKEQSEIPLERLVSMTYTEFHNMVRALVDPYPNAFISLKGKRVYIQEDKRVDSVPEGGSVINDEDLDDGGSIYVRLSDSFAELVRYRAEKSKML